MALILSVTGAIVLVTVVLVGMWFLATNVKLKEDDEE